MLFRDIAYERRRTRDLLLDYAYDVLPVIPRQTASLPIIYPWAGVTSSVLSKQIYEIAKNNGFVGTEAEFLIKFANMEEEIFIGSIDTFPPHGEEDKLYLDQTTGVLYYFKVLPLPLDGNYPGAIIADSTDEICSIYLPIYALAIQDTI